MEAEVTDAERYLVVDGRRWRRQDPILDHDIVAALKSHLGRARSALSRSKDPALRERVGLAKRGLGERGDPWWELSDKQRRDRADDALEQLARLDAPSTTELQEAIVTMLTERKPTVSICPSDVARALHPEPGWRGLMKPIREAAAGLAESKIIRVTRGDDEVDARNPGGPIRLRRGPDWPDWPGKRD